MCAECTRCISDPGACPVELQQQKQGNILSIKNCSTGTKSRTCLAAALDDETTNLSGSRHCCLQWLPIYFGGAFAPPPPGGVQKNGVLLPCWVPFCTARCIRHHDKQLHAAGQSAAVTTFPQTEKILLQQNTTILMTAGCKLCCGQQKTW